MVERLDVDFTVDGGVRLRAWLYLPDDISEKRPGITMAHGFGGTRWHGIAGFAEAFADAGFVVLLHDHRNFGASAGEERGDIDPWQQISDWRYAISYLECRQEVDIDRIGLWGTSYAGGHALVLGATDRRLRAIVAQVPTISGYEQSLRRTPPEAVAALEADLATDDRRRFLGEPPLRRAIASADPDVAASYRTTDAVAFYRQNVPDGVWENDITLRSARAARMYEPGRWVARVSPTPLLMIIALGDTITMTDLGLSAYESALEPKSLLCVPGGHFDPYLGAFADTSAAAVQWFQQHLGTGTHVQEQTFLRDQGVR